MALIAETNHHHIVEFAAHLAVWAERGGSVDLCAHIDVSFFAGGERSANAASLHDFGISADVDGAFGDVEESTFDPSALLDEYFRSAVLEESIADDRVGGAEPLRLASGGKHLEVGCELFAVFNENVVEKRQLVGSRRQVSRCGDVFLFEIVLRAAESNHLLLFAIAVAERFAQVELHNSLGEHWRRQDVRCNEYVVLSGTRRELVLEIIGSDVRDRSVVAE